MLNKLTLKGNNPGPHLLITAGVHGDEYEPMEASRRVYKEMILLEQTLSGRLTIVPVVNKPAFELGSRTGNDQLDLARSCPGDKNGSETQQIAYTLSELIHTADYYVDLHTGGRLHNIYPFTGYMIHPESQILQEQRKMAKSFLLPIIWGTDPQLQGRTLSIARDANIPAIYAEIGGSCVYDETMMSLAFNGCMNLLKYLKMIPAKPFEANIKYHLEDHRASSGHLQQLLPSPCDGFYIPNVSFGQRVKVGDIIGTIQDEVGEIRTDIKADQAGIVFILRSLPSVKKGDALGAILPVKEDDKRQNIYE